MPGLFIGHTVPTTRQSKDTAAARDRPVALSQRTGHGRALAAGGAPKCNPRCSRGLGGKHRVVRVAEDEPLRCAPNDPFQFHECAHLEPVPPQQHVLNEVPSEAPGPERQSPITDRVEAESARLVDEKIGAEKIVAPIVEEGGDAPVILLTATMIQRPRSEEHTSEL